MNDKTKHENIHMPDTLPDRVSRNGTGEKDFSTAGDAIEAMAEEFIRRLPEQFLRLDIALEDLETTPEDVPRRNFLFRHVHDLKGQAGTFDYDLITIIGNDLCRFLERPVAMTPNRLKVARFHVDAMKLVARARQD